jgi:hypothetical protein
MIIIEKEFKTYVSIKKLDFFFLKRESMLYLEEGALVAKGTWVLPQ